MLGPGYWFLVICLFRMDLFILTHREGKNQGINSEQFEHLALQAGLSGPAMTQSTQARDAEGTNE